MDINVDNIRDAIVDWDHPFDDNAVASTENKDLYPRSYEEILESMHDLFKNIN